MPLLPLRDPTIASPNPSFADAILPPEVVDISAEYNSLILFQ